MATITTLNAGDEVDASVLNTNFSNLNTDITNHSTTIGTMSTTVTSLQSTVSTISGATVPVGTVIFYGRSFAGDDTIIPTGYILCNGAAFSRTDFSALFNKIGTSFGAGDGSTTFNVPNLIDKIIKGANTVNQWYTTITSSGKNLKHGHQMSGFMPGSAGWGTDNALDETHTHTTTIATVTLLPCIKY